MYNKRIHIHVLCFICICTAPPALTVNMKNIQSSSSIFVEWDKVDDSLTTTYIVTWASERDHIVHHVALIEQSSYTITGLTLDTVYTITVTAANTCGQGPEYRTTILLATNATTTLSSLSPTFTGSTNPMTVMSSSSNTITTTLTVIASFNTAATSTSTIAQHSTTSTTDINPSATATDPITTTVSRINDTTISFIETANVKTTIGSTTSNISATTIVMSTISTTNPANPSTVDKSSKFQA